MWQSVFMGTLLLMNQNGQARPTAASAEATAAIVTISQKTGEPEEINQSDDTQKITIESLATAPAPVEKPTILGIVAPEQWYLMQQLQGNWLGAVMNEERTSISGWIEQSYTASTVANSNRPVVWNDLPNEYLLNSFWLRLERSTIVTGTTEPTWGYRLDLSTGTDYRYSIDRGLFDGQLTNSETTVTGQPKQNIYGVDPVQFYVNAYVPTLFQGTDIRVGRLFTPWGFGSIEGPSAPFVSRSYTFNWGSPFTHMGIMVSPTFNDQWSGKFMLANGNDIFLVAGEEMRSVGSITWTALDKRDSVSLGWTLGRGKFNAGDPFNPATASLPSEPAGRNNINVLDLVFNHKFNAAWSYAAEVLYGYQTNVPANVPGGIISSNNAAGTAHWASIAQFGIYTISPELTSVTRLEFFDDIDGQRTGFQGLYTAITTGLYIRPNKSLLIRPEIRYDYNGESRPFENRHGIFTTAMDMIIRF